MIIDFQKLEDAGFIVKNIGKGVEIRHVSSVQLPEDIGADLLAIPMIDPNEVEDILDSLADDIQRRQIFNVIKS